MKYLSIMLLGASLLVVGCDQRDKTTTTSTTTTTPSTMSTDRTLNPPNSISDSDAVVTQRVKKAIQDDSTLSSQARAVIISVNDGVVTLKGTVNSESLKDRLTSLAKNTAGVKSVDNQTEVSK